MLNYIVYVLIYFLAIYGALSLIIGLMNSQDKRIKFKNSNNKLVLFTKDSEETIEGIVRSICRSDFNCKNICNGMLTIVDMGSIDDTISILNKLENDYCNLEIIKEDEKERVFIFS